MRGLRGAVLTLGSSVLVAGGISGCGAAPEAALEEHGIDVAREEVRGGNGLGPNGFGPNGLGPNGLGPNGLGPNGLGPNGLGPNGLGPNGLGAYSTGSANDDADRIAAAVASNPELATFFKYLLTCALSSSQSITIPGVNGGAAVTGIFGFGTSWKTGAMTVAQRDRVSSCVAARVNPQTTSVEISLGTQDPNTAELPVDRAYGYIVPEAVFAANIFGTNGGDLQYAFGATPVAIVQENFLSTLNFRNGQVPASRTCGPNPASCGFEDFYWGYDPSLSPVTVYTKPTYTLAFRLPGDSAGSTSLPDSRAETYYLTSGLNSGGANSNMVGPLNNAHYGLSAGQVVKVSNTASGCLGGTYHYGGNSRVQIRKWSASTFSWNIVATLDPTGSSVNTYYTIPSSGDYTVEVQCTSYPCWGRYKMEFATSGTCGTAVASSSPSTPM